MNSLLTLCVASRRKQSPHSRKQILVLESSLRKWWAAVLVGIVSFSVHDAGAVTFYSRDMDAATGWTSGDDDSGCDGDRDYWGRVACRFRSSPRSLWCAANREGDDAADPDCGHYYDCQGAFLITEAIDISSYTNVTCSFYWWLSSYSGDNFEVYYSSNGSSWTLWDSWAGHYESWSLATIPVPAGWTALYVRFYYNTNTVTWDREGAYIDDFSVSGDPPVLSVTNPVAGSWYTVGTPMTVSWTRSGGSPDAIDIYQSTNGGGSWSALALGLPGSATSWSWSNPQGISAQNRIKLVWSYSPSLSGETQTGNFTLGQWSMNVTSPPGGQTYPVGMQMTISWTASAQPVGYSSFDVQRSTNGGGAWSTIGSGRPGGDRSFTWNTTGAPVSSNSLVRVLGYRYAGDAAPIGANSAIFNLAASPAQTYSVPAASGSYGDLSPLQIQWSNAGQSISGYVLKHSTDGGNTWPETLASLAGSSTSWIWNMPRPPGANHRVKLDATVPCGTYAITSGTFTVRNDPAAFAWTNPGGGLWSDSLNWSPLQVPGYQDTAYITLPGEYTVTLNSGTADIARLVLGRPPSQDTLQQTLLVDCPSCNLLLRWHSVIRASGVLGIYNHANVSVTGTGVILSDSGNIVMQGGALFPSIQLGVNDTLDLPTGNLSILGGAVISGASGVVVNRGCLTVNSGASEADISATLVNQMPAGRTPGTIDILGCIRLSRLLNTGAMRVHTNATARAAGRWDNSGTIEVQGSTCEILASDTVFNTGGANLQGAVRLTGEGVMMNDGVVTYQGSTARSPSNGIISVEFHNLAAAGEVNILGDTLSLLNHGDNAGIIRVPDGTVLQMFNTFSSVAGEIQGDGDVQVIIADLVMRASRNDLIFSWTRTFATSVYDIYFANHLYDDPRQYTLIATTGDTTYTLLNGASSGQGFYRIEHR